MSSPDHAYSPVVVGMDGLTPSAEERALFAEMRPFGFILFARNIATPEQVSSLCAELRDIIANPDAPVLIDQEGGRVARLQPPYWPQLPPAAELGKLYLRDPDAALDAAYDHGRSLSDMLAPLGINVDCAPVLDLPGADSDPVIGDRAFATDPEIVGKLGVKLCLGLLDGGVLPILKHIPGHGRAQVDSHVALPRVDAALEDLQAHDFVPFRHLAGQAFGTQLWAMSAHVAYSAIDPELPASLSAKVIDRVIRGDIGFRGPLIVDDIGMGALSGDIGARAVAALNAGNDLALHCSGDFAELQAVFASLKGRVLPESLIAEWQGVARFLRAARAAS